MTRWCRLILSVAMLEEWLILDFFWWRLGKRKASLRMIERFENLTTGVSRIYKDIQKIKKQRMTTLGLKGTQVMCIYYLFEYPDGMTAASLSRLCQEDKAATSRILSELEELGLVSCGGAASGRKYRTHIFLTDKGKAYAEQVNSMIFQATADGGEDITEEERQIFYRVLAQIAHNLDKVCKTFQ